MNAFNSAFSLTKGAFNSSFKSSGGASGTKEITVYTALDGPNYLVDDGERSYNYRYLAINKTLTSRYVFYFVDTGTGSGSPPSFDNITAYIPIDAAAPLSASVIAGLLQAEAAIVGFNASVLNANVTFTASENGNMPNAEADIGGLTITQGS